MPSAACVVWSKHKHGDGGDNPYILTGIESRYVRDTHKEINIDDVKLKKQPSSFANLKLTPTKQSGNIRMEDFEKVARKELTVAATGATTATAATAAHVPDELTRAKVVFGKRAVALEELFGTRIQFDTPSLNSGVYRVNFRWADTSTHYGITKGQIEGSEEPLAAIVREIGEETGVKLSLETARKKLIELGKRDDCTFFSLELESKEVDVWKDVIARRLDKRHGELFNLAFVPKHQLSSHFQGKKMNRKTEVALRLFSSSPSASHTHGHAHGPSGKGGSSRNIRRSSSKKRSTIKRIFYRKKRDQKSKKRRGR